MEPISGQQAGYGMSGWSIDPAGRDAGMRGANGKPQKQDDDKEVEELKRIDRQVRAHEAAHLAAASGLARGGASYSFKVGPDGVRYAVGGEVSIDTSAEKKPADTIRKMERVKAAALAPSDPSPQDRAVAAEASAQEAQAQKELAAQKQKPACGTSKAAARAIKAYTAGKTPTSTLPVRYA